MKTNRPTPHEYNELLQLWEASVRSTHHFLTEGDIQFYKSIVPQYFPKVDLYVTRDEQNKITAFMGLSEEVIEMLFVHPNEQGKGLGKQLIHIAINDKKIKKVDVNEQNTSALQFYLHIGFRIIGRNSTDASGKPVPILHLQLA